MSTASKVTARQAFERVLAALDQHRCAVDYKPGADKAKARCPVPAHDDQTPSLSISVEGKRVLVKCHAGCTFPQIAEALELPQSAFFAEDDKKKVRPRRNVVKTPYYATDATGTTHGIHWREDFTYADDGTPGKKMWWEPEGIKTANMPLWNTPAAFLAAPDVAVWLTEGEPKAKRLQDELSDAGWADVVLATMTGAGGMPCDDSLQILLGRKVTFWPDNDADGKQHMRKIARRLLEMGAKPEQLHVLDWTDAPPKGDAADYFAAGHTVDGLEQMTRPYPLRRSSTDEDPPKDAHSQEESTFEEDEHLSEIGELLSEVETELIEWLWDGRIVLGKINMSDGDPGLGKTMWALDIAARVTRGSRMPDGSIGVTDPSGVVYFTAEDGVGDTIKPRLVAAGGDPTKVLAVTTIKETKSDGKVIERQPTFRDIDIIRGAINRVRAKIAIFDPFMAYLNSTTNSFRDQDIRTELAPIARLADETGAAFLLIRHLNKGSSSNPMYRGGGSIGIIGAARSGLIVAQHPDDESRRVLSSVKSNLGRRPADLEYSIAENAEGIPAITWHGASQYSAVQLVSMMGNENRGPSKLDAACELLREILLAGPCEEETIKGRAREAQISWATIRRAKKNLGVKSEREGFGKDGKWIWRLPPVATGEDESAKDAQGDEDAHKDAHPQNDEHLWTETGSNGATEADSPIDAHVPGNEHLNGHHRVDEHLSDEWSEVREGVEPTTA